MMDTDIGETLKLDEVEESDEDSWVEWFCDKDGNKFLVEVDAEWIKDKFNLFGIKSMVPNFDKALQYILSVRSNNQIRSFDGFSTQSIISTVMLYGLIHSRYIIAPRGLAIMKYKYTHGVFGQCPRVLCEKQNVLPIGLSDLVGFSSVRAYCPKCQEVYQVPRKKYAKLDGAFFGASFPHIFLQTFPNLVPLDPPEPYCPRIHGFKVNGFNSIVEYKLERGEYGDSLIPKHLRTISCENKDKS